MTQIIKLVKDAQDTKAPTAQIADIISGYFIPVVCLISLLAGLTWYFGMGSDLEFALTIFISILVIACPYALGLATPQRSWSEPAHKINTIVFAKTGTIAEGKPTVTDIVTTEDTEPQICFKLRHRTKRALNTHWVRRLWPMQRTGG